MVAVLMVLSSCFPFSAGEKQLDGPYYLWAADTSEQMALYYRVSEGTGVNRIPSTVFAVGWDAKHIIAKRHPYNDRSVTQYYILERAKDSAMADPGASVTGPLSVEQFEAQRPVLGVAPTLGFSYTIPSLQ